MIDPKVEPINIELLKKNSTAIGYRSFKLGTSITPEQKQFFDRHGFLHFKGVFSPEEVTTIKSQLDEMERQIIAENRLIINGIPIKFGKDENEKTIIQRMPFTSMYSPKVHELVNSERIRPVVTLIENGRIGENEKDGVVFNHYVNTENSAYKTLGWHTDSLRELAYLEKIRPMLNVGIHLDFNPATNGGLRVLPGTHKQSIFSLLTKKIHFADIKADKREVAIESDPGDLTVHDGRMWHRVQAAPIRGTNSHRRVMYFPVLCGPYNPKDENSITPYYFRLMRGVKHFSKKK